MTEENQESYVPGSGISQQLPVAEGGPDALPGDNGIRNVPEGDDTGAPAGEDETPDA